MRSLLRILPVVAAAFVAACGSDSSTGTSTPNGLRVVNALTSPVDVMVDQKLVLSAIAPGAVGMVSTTPGSHDISLTPSGSASSANLTITSATGGVNTVAALRSSSGGVSSAVLDDTGSVVPAGATKVRVLHFAPNAGTLQVYRTQPDYQTPISWQFPFTYQSAPNSLSAPFYQSTPGTWEIRIWQTPADASGWTNAPVKVVLPLGSGEKRTIMILDAPGGGVRAEVL